MRRQGDQKLLLWELRRHWLPRAQPIFEPWSSALLQRLAVQPPAPVLQGMPVPLPQQPHPRHYQRAERLDEAPESPWPRAESAEDAALVARVLCM